MNLKQAVAVAKQQVSDLFAPDAPHDVRLETFLYDDHLAVWSLTIGFALPDHPGARRPTNPFCPSGIGREGAAEPGSMRSRQYGVSGTPAGGDFKQFGRRSK